MIVLSAIDLLCGAIATDYEFRHELVGKATRALKKAGVAATHVGLLEAAEKGDLVSVKNLKKVGVDLGAVGRQGETALITGIEAGQDRVVSFLLTNPSVRETVSQEREPDQVSAVSLSLENENWAVAKKLTKLGADVSGIYLEGEPALYHAITQDDAELFDQLISLGVDPKQPVDGQPALAAFALAAGRQDWLTKLSKLGVSLDSVGPDGLPILLSAVDQRDVDLVSTLLEAGADPSVTCASGQSPLALALAADSDELARRLLDAGANPDVPNLDGDLLAVDAVERGDVQQLKALLEAGASVDQLCAKRGINAVHASIESGDFAVMDQVIAVAKDLDKPARSGASPLELAVATGHVPAVEALAAAGAKKHDALLMTAALDKRDSTMLASLIQRGADPNTKISEDGLRVFDQAVQIGATHAVRALLQNGAEVGDNFWAAILTGDDELVRVMLSGGVDATATGPNGESPLAYCLAGERIEMAISILDAGADPQVYFDGRESRLAKSVREGREDLALAFLRAGASLGDGKARDGHSLISWSIANDMTETAKALLKAGADPQSYERYPAGEEFRSKFRQTSFRRALQYDRRIRPLMAAAAQKNHEVAQALVDAGAKLNQYTRSYMSPESIGAWTNDVRMMQIAILGEAREYQFRKLIIDLSSQRIKLYENGQITYSGPVSTGKKGHRTPPGEYVITQKSKHHVSNIYNSKMPYFMRFSCSAFGTHQGNLPGYRASAGCIRMTMSGARTIFNKMERGDYAIIVP